MPDDNDDSIHQTPDDALEPADDIFNPNKDEETLDQDYDSPAASPDDVAGTIAPDHPDTDTDIDAHDAYDEGLKGASGIDAQEETAVQEVLPLDPKDENENT
jgi:hypothetical protein